MEDKTDQLRVSPAAVLFGGAVLSAFDYGNGDTDGEQMWEGQWWRPKWGCDTLARLIEAVEELPPPNVPAETREEKTMNDTQDIAKVGSSALVRLGDSVVTPKDRPDSPGWWWRWWRQRWICGQVDVLDDSGKTLVWSFQSRMCDVAVLQTQFTGSLWVKADLPSFEPSAVEVAQALDAVPNSAI